MAVLVLAVLLFLLWVLLVGAVHVTTWFVHALLIVALVAAVVWAVNRLKA